MINDKTKFIVEYSLNDYYELEVYIPKSVIYIAENVFKESDLVTIYCEEKEEDIVWNRNWEGRIHKHTIIWNYKNQSDKSE